jgi:adenine-specific DNA-methyltransferase
MKQMSLSQREILEIQIMRYMGNKRGILRFLVPLLDELLDPGAIFLDLFAGTCAVGYAMKPRNVVFANDIQEYSCVISKTLLSESLQVYSPSQAKEELSERYYENYESLRAVFGDVMEHESGFLRSRVTNARYQSYKGFVETYPYYDGKPVRSNLYDDSFLSWFQEPKIANYRADPHQFPYVLFSTYFANGYFGLEQCAQIDSLRYAIDQVANKRRRMVYMTCLISALSNAVSSTGHFAQFRNVTSKTTCQSLIEERAKSIVDMFYAKLEELISNFVENDGLSRFNRCYSLEYADLLTTHRSEIADVGLVYADPPYTTANYSRFYHVLETLVKYDYPTNFYIGRYRNDRFISGFCKYSTAEEEFRKLTKLSASIGAPLAISYSSNGILRPERIAKIAQEHYSTVETHAMQHRHSQPGRRSKGGVSEYLIRCSDPGVGELSDF